ncbi:hypothetical protein CF336_g6105 [Tilletia laevis]|uniref:Uncharacterized protein n=1 Tax=Tilletia caries TaxID=13290 RepID=A0A177UA26_9BASI|nr:hypothetical protein CF336_g6105 [Tilletia laevis]KAE8193957.1 hypothetical protein CF335_g5463 [Tilletia laevis]KAE8255888.1 hypothetical protein A4X03_0g5495 [Tilletia caries]
MSDSTPAATQPEQGTQQQQQQQQSADTPRNLHISLPPQPDVHHPDGATPASMSLSSAPAPAPAPAPAHGILLSRNTLSPAASLQKPSATFIASPTLLTKDDDDRLILFASPPKPSHERTSTATTAASTSTPSKLTTLINKLGRRTGSSGNTKGGLSSIPAGNDQAESGDRDHHHKRSKSTKSRNGSGRHTPVVEGEYGQFLAAAELRAALEREQIKANKRAEKEKPSGKASKVNPAAAAAAASAAAAGAQKALPGGPLSKAQAQEVAVAMKPSRSLPGAFGSVSRKSSRSGHNGNGTITPKARRAHTDLRPPNPCGMPVSDSDSDSGEHDDDDDDDGHTYLDDQTLAAFEYGPEGEGSAAGHHSPKSSRKHDGTNDDNKRKKQRVNSISFGATVRRRPFFSRVRSGGSTPRALSRRSSFSSSASSTDSIVRTSYPADLVAMNARELRNGAPADGTNAEQDISSTRSIKSWRSHPSGTSSLSGGGLSSDTNVVLSKPLLDLEEFELDNFIKNFSRHTREVRVPVSAASAASRRMPQWSDFKVPANEAEIAAAEGRKVTVLTHVDRGLQAILQGQAGSEGMGSSTAAAAAGVGQVAGTPGTHASGGDKHGGGDKHLILHKRKGSSGAAAKHDGGKHDGGASVHPAPPPPPSASGHAVSTSEGKQRASIQLPTGTTAAAIASGSPAISSANKRASMQIPTSGNPPLPGPIVPESPHVKWAAGARGDGHGRGSSGSRPTTPSHSAANSPAGFSFTPLFPDVAGAPVGSGSETAVNTTTATDDGWEVIEGVAVKHEDGKALLDAGGSSEVGHYGGGGGHGTGYGTGGAGGGKEDEEQVDAVAFVIAYILAMVEKHAPEELDDRPDDRYREGKLRSHLERLYIIAPFWERFLFGVRSLYRWEQPRRTGAAAMIYFVLWYTDLIPTAIMLSLMYYILQFRFFPPSESFLHEQVRKRMSRGIEADKFSEQLRRRSRLDLLDLYKHWIDRYGVASQVAAGDIADFHEKVKNLILWRNPTATWRTFSLLCTATLFVTFAPAHYVWKIALFFLGLTFFILLPLQSHYPRYRRPLSPIWWALWGSPTDFMWGSKILRERHAKLHSERAQALSESRGGTKEGGKTHLYSGLFHSRKGGGRHAHDGTTSSGNGAALDALAMGGNGTGNGTSIDGDSDEAARKEMIAEQAKEAQRGKKLSSFFCQHHTVPGHLHVTTKMIYFVALHSTRPSNSRKTCKTELDEIAGLVKTNNFRLFGFQGLKIRKRDGKSMHFSNMSHRDDAFNLSEFVEDLFVEGFAG